ncbi:MAG TPA: hypothetical protein VMV95_01590 [Bacillota bacterium]|nr:hypothetical protein [Bacillota bacterium]
MPKKSKKDEILEELAEKLKENKTKKSSEEKENEGDDSEKSELEENVDLNALELDQFIQPMHFENIKAPILERIAGSQPGPIFVGGISRAPQTISGEEEKSNEVKYVPGQEENNEPKYTESSSRISTEPERADFSKIGRETAQLNQPQETFFMHPGFQSQTDSSESRRQWKAEQVDITRAGRENPLDRQETKYEKYKPKSPKSH